MRIDEISLDPLANKQLSSKHFKQVLKLLSDKVSGGNSNAIAIKNSVMTRWAAGDKLANSYKPELISIGVDLDSIL